MLRVFRNGVVNLLSPHLFPVRKVAHAVHEYGFWILVVVVAVLILLTLLNKNLKDVLQKKCVYWENKTLNLEQARKESSDMFSFAVLV